MIMLAFATEEEGIAETGHVTEEVDARGHGSHNRTLGSPAGMRRFRPHRKSTHVPMSGASSARIGCSGWNYASWKEDVYGGAPSTSWLTIYASLYDTVEVNSTFYRLPTAKTTQRWAETTPHRFTFAVKASRYLTHVKRLRDLQPGLERMYKSLRPLIRTGKLGPILWQLPATLQRDDDRLQAAVAVLPPGLHAFEFRHSSWFAEDIYEILRRHGIAVVIADHAARPLPTPPSTASWAYVRLHFGHRGRNGNYSRSEILEWAERIQSWQRPTWVYFNNDWEAFAPANARELRRVMREAEPAPGRPGRARRM
jgi:uncharacterized protein YecE (DUF72 family)